MSEQETPDDVGGEGEEEEEDDTCDGGCGKVNDSEFDVPTGWLLLVVTHGDENEDEEADGVVCSSACAKAWLDKEWPSA